MRQERGGDERRDEGPVQTSSSLPRGAVYRGKKLCDGCAKDLQRFNVSATVAWGILPHRVSLGESVTCRKAGAPTPSSHTAWEHDDGHPPPCVRALPSVPSIGSLHGGYSFVTVRRVQFCDRQAGQDGPWRRWRMRSLSVEASSIDAQGLLLSLFKRFLVQVFP